MSRRRRRRELLYLYTSRATWRSVCCRGHQNKNPQDDRVSYYMYYLFANITCRVSRRVCTLCALVFTLPNVRGTLLQVFTGSLLANSHFVLINARRPVRCRIVELFVLAELYSFELASGVFGEKGYFAVTKSMEIPFSFLSGVSVGCNEELMWDGTARWSIGVSVLIGNTTLFRPMVDSHKGCILYRVWDNV